MMLHWRTADSSILHRATTVWWLLCEVVVMFSLRQVPFQGFTHGVAQSNICHMLRANTAAFPTGSHGSCCSCSSSYRRDCHRPPRPGRCFRAPGCLLATAGYKHLEQFLCGFDHVQEHAPANVWKGSIQTVSSVSTTALLQSIICMRCYCFVLRCTG